MRGLFGRSSTDLFHMTHGPLLLVFGFAPIQIIGDAAMDDPVALLGLILLCITWLAH